MQAKLSFLREEAKKADSAASARAVTVAVIERATACTKPDDAKTAKVYCELLARVSGFAESSGCDVIMSAGAIPVIVSFLARWPADEEVVINACSALHSLAYCGSETVKAAMRSVPRIGELLRAARVIGMRVSLVAAAEILRMLRL